MNKSGLIWHILYTHFCVKITCWLIISKLCCGLSASVYIKPECEKNTLEISGAKFPLSFSIMVVLNGKIYIIVLAACDMRKIQVSCPKLKMIRITILIVQAKYLFLFQTQKDLDSFTGIKSRLILLFSIISVTINNWKHKSEFPSHSSLYQNYLWVYWLTEGNVASILLSLYYITKV